MTDEPTEQPPAQPPAEQVATEQPESMIDRLNSAVDRQEKATAEFARETSRREALHVEETLGGKADTTAQVKKEETPEEYAAKVIANDTEE